MSKLLNKSLKRFTVYAGIVLTCSIPVYYFAISQLWQYELDEHDIILTAEAGREDSFLIIGAVTLLTVFFFALILGGFVWLNRKISRRLWQPFYQTLSKIKTFDLNNHTSIEFEPGNIIEFQELNASIKRLVDNNVMSYRQQKEFTENASHELQTPLAIVQSKLDLLLQDPALTLSQSGIIEETNNALSRVSRINKNLLLLAKIENQQFLEQQVIDISLIIDEILDQLSGLFGEKNIKCAVNAKIMVNGNKMLLEIMLTNLLMNALRHAAAKGEIEILLYGKELKVSNSGAYALEPERLFRRFSTASIHTPGSGLGLSIVKEICNRYGWVVRYDFKEMKHNFTVEFER